MDIILAGEVVTVTIIEPNFKDHIHGLLNVPAQLVHAILSSFCQMVGSAFCKHLCFRKSTNDGLLP